MQLALSELNSKRTTRFIGLLALLLYWSHLAARAGRDVEQEQLSALYCAVQHYFASVRERMKKRRATLLFVLPTLLLLVRVAVEALFRQAFPKWWTTVDARETLQRMDDTIESIFDPNEYLSQISSLESSTEAMRIAARKQQGLKQHGARYARYYTTSALVQSALPDAAMVARHRHLGGNTLPAVAGSLSQQARQQLFHAALASAGKPVPSKTAGSAGGGAASGAKPVEKHADPVTHMSALKGFVVPAATEPQRKRTEPSECANSPHRAGGGAVARVDPPAARHSRGTAKGVPSAAAGHARSGHE